MQQLSQLMNGNVILLLQQEKLVPQVMQQSKQE